MDVLFQLGLGRRETVAAEFPGSQSAARRGLESSTTKPETVLNAQTGSGERVQQQPHLWSFRRCPYAIRARMALDACGASYEHREILLRNKPAQMLAESAKGTVPILVLADGNVIDESIHIMRWALARNDPEDWLSKDPAMVEETQGLVDALDEFKPLLDRYKYSSRHPEQSPDEHRARCEHFLCRLDTSLTQNRFLLGDSPRFADIAIFPFVRQFHNVDRRVLGMWTTGELERWLQYFVDDARFLRVMRKHPLWSAEAD